jgi:hypothetical protein
MSMNPTLREKQPAVDAAERLCSALNQVANALVGLDLETLLAAEQTLSEVVRSFPPLQQSEADDSEIKAVVQQARAALLRCRRLGASFASVARERLHACSGSDEYGRAGAYVPRPSVSTVKVRV